MSEILKVVEQLLAVLNASNLNIEEERAALRAALEIQSTRKDSPIPTSE